MRAASAALNARTISSAASSKESGTRVLVISVFLLSLARVPPRACLGPGETHPGDNPPGDTDRQDGSREQEFGSNLVPETIPHRSEASLTRSCGGARRAEALRNHRRDLHSTRRWRRSWLT